MKRKIIKIAKDLEKGTITTEKAKKLLLDLFRVSGSSCISEELDIKICPKCGSSDIILFDRGFHKSDKCANCGESF